MLSRATDDGINGVSSRLALQDDGRHFDRFGASTENEQRTKAIA